MKAVLVGLFYGVFAASLLVGVLILAEAREAAERCKGPKMPISCMKSQKFTVGDMKNGDVGYSSRYGLDVDEKRCMWLSPRWSLKKEKMAGTVLKITKMPNGYHVQLLVEAAPIWETANWIPSDYIPVKSFTIVPEKK